MRWWSNAGEAAADDMPATEVKFEFKYLSWVLRTCPSCHSLRFKMIVSSICMYCWFKFWFRYFTHMYYGSGGWRHSYVCSQRWRLKSSFPISGTTPTTGATNVTGSLTRFWVLFVGLCASKIFACSHLIRPTVLPPCCYSTCTPYQLTIYCALPF